MCQRLRICTRCVETSGGRFGRLRVWVHAQRAATRATWTRARHGASSKSSGDYSSPILTCRTEDCGATPPRPG